VVWRNTFSIHPRVGVGATVAMTGSSRSSLGLTWRGRRNEPMRRGFVRHE
jgi:hypothetical protein